MEKDKNWETNVHIAITYLIWEVIETCPFRKRNKNKYWL